MNSTESNNSLSRAEVDFFVENGYLAPYAAISPAEMKPFRAATAAQVIMTDGPNPRRPTHSRPLDTPDA